MFLFMKSNTNRRHFLHSIALLAASTGMPISAFAFTPKDKLRVVLVGTGIRGITFWGKRLQEQYAEILEFVGLCDRNEGRLRYGRDYIGTNCPLFSDFETMIRETKPDLVIVTTKDSTHHQFIIRGLELGCDVLTEKPLTTDAEKCQAIIEAERKSGKKLIVGFNYRWSPYATKIKEILMEKQIGEITSVDFHWYLNTYHGADYFRRWHGEMDSSGSLWVHKATHHFDLLNWWLDSDPEEVFAYGSLEFYGSHGPFRGNNCRDCQHKANCDFHWDILKDDFMTGLYVSNESYDGYVRDNCVFRDRIDIYDKMSAQIKYANQAVVNYSLTTYSPYEGWRIAFNGTQGRLEAWLDIPYMAKQDMQQDDLHRREMDQTAEEMGLEPIIVQRLWEDYKTVLVPFDRAGHGGGDELLQNKLFISPTEPDPYQRAAGLRDGAMSALIGIAARDSIVQHAPIQIASLTDLKPRPQRDTSKE